jgi:predicted anti-sigma-YlaC factor YlaD
MFCDEVLERVDGIAAGEAPVEARLTSHLKTCAGCAAALGEAARLQQLLAARPVPRPPPHFAARTLTRIRRERWRREQFFDTAFNALLGLALLALVAAVWMIADRSGFTAVTGGAWSLVTEQFIELAARVAPSLGLYAAAAALIGAALGLWWWAERTDT